MHPHILLPPCFLSLSAARSAALALQSWNSRKPAYATAAASVGKAGLPANSKAEAKKDDSNAKAGAKADAKTDGKAKATSTKGSNASDNLRNVSLVRHRQKAAHSRQPVAPAAPSLAADEAAYPLSQLSTVPAARDAAAAMPLAFPPLQFGAVAAGAVMAGALALDKDADLGQLLRFGRKVSALR
jgi:hypothetical protein